MDFFGKRKARPKKPGAFSHGSRSHNAIFSNVEAARFGPLVIRQRLNRVFLRRFVGRVQRPENGPQDGLGDIWPRHTPVETATHTRRKAKAPRLLGAL